MEFHQFGPPEPHPGWWFLGGVIPLVLFGVLIAVAVWAVIRVTATRTRAVAGWTGAPRRDDALEEVRLRYARGQMNRDEFVLRYRDLGGVERPPSEPPPPEPPPTSPPAA
jgi:uncharacterized membrane protein